MTSEVTSGTSKSWRFPKMQEEKGKRDEERIMLISDLGPVFLNEW